jgi:hypothetical protein
VKRLRSLDTLEWIAAGYLCFCIAMVAVGIAYSAGWAGDSPRTGMVAILVGLLASVVELRRILRMRGETPPLPLDDNLLVPPAKHRPLTYALVTMLAGLIFGLVVADISIGVIFALAGFAVGWVSALPIEKRRR